MQRACGFTRASALGPIASFVDQRGGSIQRVFERADLPLAILDHPDMALPLPEQFRVLQEAARNTGDPYLGARLGRLVRIEQLSGFGRWVAGADSFGGSIDRSNRGLNLFLQTGTKLQLRCFGARTRWSIEFLDPGFEGRFQNELLGLSYLIDVGRLHHGRAWHPLLIRVTGTRPCQAARLERIFGAPVRAGCDVPAIEFATTDLARTRLPNQSTMPRSSAGSDPDRLADPMPETSDQIEAVSAITAIAMLEGYPKIDWVASKLSLTRRTLQRKLDAQGVSFSRLVDSLLKERAIDYLTLGNRSITDIALQLGYSDPAHFHRAFRRWTGCSPSAFRARHSAKPPMDAAYL